MNINFILGEDKYLKFLVKSTKNEEFEISRATYKLYKDRELEVVSKLLGHANITITYNKYIHVIKEQEAIAMNMVKVC